MAKEINEKKELVIRERLREILGIEIDLQEELKRRFKRLSRVRQGNEETIYFDDGSIEGKRIVTFVRKDMPFNPETFIVGYEETYY
jgi:hypothetical protein